MILGCEDTSIGIEARGIIPDSSFTASSTYDYRYKPYFARIGDTRGHGWDQGDPQNDNYQYLQIDLGFDYFVCAIATKAGRIGGWGEYVKTYKITMSNDKQKWTPYKEDGRDKVRITNKLTPTFVR
ncbi:Lactadherin [Exaiptasia diaphana]|nr:Lactadherin [Exaiptasia diaphana]